MLRVCHSDFLLDLTVARRPFLVLWLVVRDVFDLLSYMCFLCLSLCFSLLLSRALTLPPSLSPSPPVSLSLPAPLSLSQADSPNKSYQKYNRTTNKEKERKKSSTHVKIPTQFLTSLTAAHKRQLSAPRPCHDNGYDKLHHAGKTVPGVFASRGSTGVGKEKGHGEGRGRGNERGRRGRTKRRKRKTL